MNDSPGPLFSVVLCTYNRAGLLTDALRSLEEQSLDRTEFEIVVVDNNSSDDTASVVESFAERLPQLRYVLETKQGLSHARNCGRRVAQGEYVSFLDDDAQAPPNWLETARDLIAERSAQIFGGPYRALYLDARPSWFMEHYGDIEPAIEAGPCAKDHFLLGGNIFIQRTLLQSLGDFDASLGMRGMQTGYGEETDFQYRLIARNPDLELWYEPALWVSHRIKPQAMTLRGAAWQRWCHGRAWCRIIAGDLPQSSRLRIALRFGGILCRLAMDVASLPLRDRKCYPAGQNYIYEKTLPHVRRLGTFYEWFRVAGSKKGFG